MLSSLDARVFEELTSPALQILAVAGPISGREGEGVLVPTGEFFLWPALLSLAATRVDVAQQRDHLHTAVIEAVKEYKREYKAGEQGGPRLGQPVDLIRLRVGALDRCLLGFVKRAIPLFHDEDADWILRQAARVAHDAERALIERGLIVKTFSPCQSFPVAAVLGLMPHPLPIRTPAGDTLLTAFREACTAPGGRPVGDFAVNRTLLLWIPEVAFLFVDLLGQG
ncbi:MAG: hypothetical protein ACREI5_01750 [Candidatus Methylomirabilales bacterium]